jgi:hypothetical protein
MSKVGNFDLLLEASRNGFEALFNEHNEEFYYCTLILSEGATPFISAFSKEALNEVVNKNDGNYSVEELKWSYADSPYCGYGFEKYFNEIDKVFCERMNDVSEGDYDTEIEYWLSLMEKVMKTLDKENVFGDRKKRRNMIINAEIMPPDDSNAQRAERLNTKSAYQKWYKENFDKINGTVSNDFCEKLSKMSRVEIALAIDKMTSAELEVAREYIKKLNKEHPL